MKFCYVCSVVSAWFLLNNPREAKKRAKKEAIKRSRQVRERGYIPLSTPLMWLDCMEEKIERDLALRAGIALLKKCDAIAFSESDLMLSEGIREELEEAKIMGKEIVRL